MPSDGVADNLGDSTTWRTSMPESRRGGTSRSLADVSRLCHLASFALCAFRTGTDRLLTSPPAPLTAIVEQATHLASLSLLFGGPARLSSVRTHTVEHSDAPGSLTKIGFDESGSVAPESRIPRYTSAVWKYEAGAVGSLTHAVALHGTTYDTELEVICDGTTFRLVDMYTSTPRLFIRESGTSSEGEGLLVFPQIPNVIAEILTPPLLHSPAARVPGRRPLPDPDRCPRRRHAQVHLR